ncbi:MAG: sigma-70 family RNA polymerase sigma factor [Deltaproteobacteria bacterium]|nr:sigma-70 family RNA polymerase sigma factor [Deltaproteobacteria bacterium]
MGIDVDSYFRAHGPMVLRRCRHLLRDEELAHDAMQDVFVKLVLHQDRIQHEAPVSLLYRMATNECLNRLRSKRRHPEHGDALLERIAVAGRNEERSIARNLLRLIFGDEQTTTGTIAVMHLLDGMSLEEVGREVGLSVSGVRKRLRTLRAHVAELEGI